MLPANRKLSVAESLAQISIKEVQESVAKYNELQCNVVGLSIKDVIESMTQAIQTDDEEIPAEIRSNSPLAD